MRWARLPHIVAVAALSMPSTGCHECDNGRDAPRCDGNARLHCYLSKAALARAKLVRHECGAEQQCVEDGNLAACVDKPVKKCDLGDPKPGAGIGHGLESDGACEGNTIVGCYRLPMSDEEAMFPGPARPQGYERRKPCEGDTVCAKGTFRAHCVAAVACPLEGKTLRGCANGARVACGTTSEGKRVLVRSTACKGSCRERAIGDGEVIGECETAPASPSASASASASASPRTPASASGR